MAMMMMKLIGGIVLAGVWCGAAADVPATQTFDFDTEAGRAGWKCETEAARFEKGTGRKGSTAAVWESASPAKARKGLARRHMPAEPGGVYRISGWMKKEKFEGKALIELNWYDRNGKWMWFRAAEPVENNLVGDGGWAYFSALTKPLPAEVGSLAISCYVFENAKGRVLFDDIVLEAAGQRTISAFSSSAYRGEVFRGSVRFAASLALNTLRHPIESTEAQLRFRGSGGRTAALTPAVFTADRVLFDVDAAAFAPGRQQVELVLSDRRDGKRLADAKIDFERLAAEPKGKVRLDGHGRLLVGGKPFFPVGMMLMGMKDEDFDRYLSSPFNFGGRYGKTTRADLDRFAAKGKYLMVDLLCRGFTARGRKGDAYVRETVAALADHPALLAWFVADEIEGDAIAAVSANTRLLHELDPDHPTYGCHNKAFEMSSLLSCYDIGGMDAYPIGAREGPDTDIGSVYQKCRTLAENTFGTMPTWHIPQTFDWSYYGRDKDPRYIDVRMPTRAEMANMSWQGVAAGGNGVMMYAYFELPRTLKGEAYERTWSEICGIGAEIVKMADVMLSVEKPRAVPTGLDERKIISRSWRHRGREWTLFVNRTRENVIATAELPKSCTKLHTAVGAGASLVAPRHVRLDFAPLGYAFVEMEF